MWLYNEIYNGDGSETGACGNGVRCVASYLMDINNLNDIIILKTIEDEIICWKEGKLIVNMQEPNLIQMKYL